MKINKENVIYLYQDTSMNCCEQTSEGLKFGKVKKKLLGIVIHRNLRFDEYILSQCKKAGKKLSVFNRISKFMTIEHRRMKSFIESRCSYCPFVCTCCPFVCDVMCWNFNNSINHLHERALRIVYNDNVSSFEDLLQRHQLFSIHHRNILLLRIELYKTRNNISLNYLNSEI